MERETKAESPSAPAESPSRRGRVLAALLAAREEAEPHPPLTNSRPSGDARTEAETEPAGEPSPGAGELVDDEIRSARPVPVIGDGSDPRKPWWPTAPDKR